MIQHEQEQEPKKVQQTLLSFSTHQTAETSKAALKSVRSKQSRRKLDIERYLLLSKASGLTRHELAQRMKIPLSSVCGLVNAMVKAGAIVEPGTTRPSPSGHTAGILVLPRYVEASK